MCLGATVHMVCRNPTRGEDVKQEIISKSNNEVGHTQVFPFSYSSSPFPPALFSFFLFDPLLICSFLTPLSSSLPSLTLPPLSHPPSPLSPSLPSLTLPPLSHPPSLLSSSSSPPQKVHLHILDISKPRDVAKFADTFVESDQALDVLV